MTNDTKQRGMEKILYLVYFKRLIYILHHQVVDAVKQCTVYIYWQNENRSLQAQHNICITIYLIRMSKLQRHVLTFYGYKLNKKEFITRRFF